MNESICKRVEGYQSLLIPERVEGVVEEDKSPLLRLESEVDGLISRDTSVCAWPFDEISEIIQNLRNIEVCHTLTVSRYYCGIVIHNYI